MRWKLINVLEEKRVEFRNLPEQHELHQGNKSHVRAGGIQPSHRRPTTRCELEYCSFQFTCRAFNVSDAHPFVLSHLQDLTDFQSHLMRQKSNDQHRVFDCQLKYIVGDKISYPDAESVANKNIQDECIPPALFEVWQKVSEGNFGDFPHDTDCPEDAEMPNEDGLEEPSEKVS